MAKKLSAKVIKEYHEAMLEVNTILGATKIIYYPLADSKEGLYKETKRAKYGEPIYLTGLTDFPQSAPDQPFDVSSIKEVQLTVEITLYGFSQYEYVNPENAPETLLPIDPYEVKKGYFIIDGKTYSIEECIPQGLFADTYTSYKYMCKGVETI